MSKLTVKEFFRESLISLPWLAIAVLGYFFLFDGEAFFQANLNVAFVKICWAVILSWLVDRGLFWSSDLQPDSVIYQARRAAIFLAITHLMSIA